MLVVSDASPINVLIRIGQIDVLPTLFRAVVIPTAVAEEMTRPSTPHMVRKNWMARPPAWFTVRAPLLAVNPKMLRHRGERDAISLAQEMQADALLLDEEKARADARALGIAVVGTVGVLQRRSGSHCRSQSRPRPPAASQVPRQRKHSPAVPRPPFGF